MIPGVEGLAFRAHAVNLTEPSTPPVEPAFLAIETAAATDLIVTVEIYAYDPPVITPPANP